MKFEAARSWIGLISLFLLFIGAVWFLIPNASTGSNQFFACSNPQSPAAFGRSDFVSPCCSGSVESHEMSRKNLMLVLSNINGALRALSRGKKSLVESPGSDGARLDCLVQSISFISESMKTFDPVKNVGEKEKYIKLLDQLNQGGILSKRAIESNNRSASVTANDAFRDTCGSCHATFR